jgi:hypothetical protein
MPDRPAASRFGLVVAVAAVAVNAPRLVLTFFAADGIVVGSRWRLALLALTGVATGVVLTGGGAYLAHALARQTEHRGVLAVVWLLVLSCAAVLVTPLLVASLDGRDLAQVLPTAPLRWAWSLVAVVAVELVAAGSMVAYTAEREADRSLADAERELLELARERNRLRDELSGRGPAPAPRPARRRRRTAQTPTHAGEQVPCRNGCGFVGRSPQAESGHQRSCPRRPAEAHRPSAPTGRAPAPAGPPGRPDAAAGAQDALEASS